MGPVDLIRAPAIVAVSVAEGALGLAIGGLRFARELLEPKPAEVEVPPFARKENARDGSPPPPREEPPAQRGPSPPPRREPPLEEEHVDEGAVLVAEVAETGAEDGAGAELEIQEPWDGYDEMTADQIVDVISDAGRESLAAVELYEAMNKNRHTVLEAAERRLRELTPPGSQTS
jgi:hypothetical protein